MRRLVPQESKRRRLDSCVCNILMYLIAVALAICSVAFCATRTHMYHMAFSKRQQQVHNDAWLLQQCRSAEFYSNMKHHSTLCDDAELAKSDAIWLHALRDVIDSTYICGGESCAVTLDRCLQWLLGRGLLTLGSVTFCLFLLLTVSLVPKKPGEEEVAQQKTQRLQHGIIGHRQDTRHSTVFYGASLADLFGEQTLRIEG